MQPNKFFKFVWSNSFPSFICTVPDKEAKLIAFLIGSLTIFTVFRKNSQHKTFCSSHVQVYV